MLRVVKIISIALASLLAAIVAAVAVYTHTAGFREFVRARALAVLNDSVRGQIAVARIDGSIWGNLVLVDVRVSDNGVEVARIPRLTIHYSLLPLIVHHVQIFGVTAEQPRLDVRQTESGGWNIVEAFQPAEPPEPEKPPSQWTIALDSLEIKNGAAVIQTKEQSSYTVRDLDTRASLDIPAAGLSVNVTQVAGVVQAGGMPEAKIHGALEYRAGGTAPALQAHDVTVETGASKITIAGSVQDFKDFNSNARVSVAMLTPADAARFVPAWPVKSAVSGNLRVAGPINALKGDFSLATASGAIDGRFGGDFAGEPLRYDAAAELKRIDLYQLLRRENTLGVASVTVQASGNGFALGNITAAANGRIDSATVNAWQIGNIAFSGKLVQRVATTKGEINGQFGRADWDGEIKLLDKPGYNFTLVADNLNVQKLSPGEKPLAGTLNFKATVNGSGVTLADLNATTHINVLPSTLGGVKIDGGTIAANVAGQRVRIAQTRLKAGDAVLEASGDLPLDVNRSGQLRYRAQVGALAPWLQLIGQTGSGSANVSGSAQGNLSDINTTGRLTARSIRYGSSAIGRGAVNYDLRYRKDAALLQGKLSFNLSDVESGTLLQNVSGTVAIPPKTPYTFDVQARVRDNQSRTHTVAADIVYDSPNVSARISELLLSLPDGTWRLTQPATVSRQQSDYVLRDVTLRNGDRQLFVDGRFSLTGTQALRLGIDRLPLDSVRAFYPLKADVSGLVTAQGELGGTAAAPQITAKIKLDNPKIAGQTYAGLSGAVDYSGRSAAFNATLQQDQQHQLTAKATVPMIVGWENGWHASSAGTISGRVSSSGLSMAFLNAFTGKSVQGIGGNLAVDLQLSGTLERPQATGLVQLRDGRLVPAALGVQVTGITMDAAVDPTGVRIQQLVARAGDGELTGSGMIGLENYQPQKMEVSINAKNWPAINTQQYRAVVAGGLKINGTLTAPQVNGKLEVLSGEVRPDLVFLERSGTPIKRDPTIRVVSSSGAEISPAPADNNNQESDTGLMRSAAVNLHIHIPNNLWVRHRNANVELSGNIDVTQSPGGKPVITGLIETVRGWIGFQGRRFNLTRGSIDLIGGEKIEAVLDVQAQYQVDNYTVTVSVTGPATKPALALKSDPQLEQSDILALLLFNKPVSQLGAGEQFSLQQNAINLTTGFAASAIGNAVVNALGLQSLGGDLDFSGGQVRYSRYVAQNTYISVGEDLTGTAGQTGSAEYQVTPNLKLGLTTSTKGNNGIDIIWHKRY